MSKARTLAGVVSTGAVLADGVIDAAEIGSLTLPTGGDIVGTTATQTLTNKTVDIASNTLTGVQASLVSGTSIKTVNGDTLLGSGDLVISSGPALGVPVTSTSGVLIDFTSIPSGTKIITVNFAGVSTNGISGILFQLGDSGGIENTGYDSSSFRGNTALTSTAGFVLNQSSAAQVLTGRIIITLINSSTNKFVAAGLFQAAAAFDQFWNVGFKSLSAELTQLRIATLNGTDTFDAGEINITME